MSQRGPAPRPASRHSSLSPAKDATSSPTSHRSLARQDDSSIQPTHDPGGLHLTESGGARRQSRTSGVHDILNPPDPRAGESGSESRPNIKEESPPHPVMGSGQYGGDGSPSHHYMYPHQHQGTTTPQQPQHSANPANQPPLPGRGSPSTTYSYLAAGRRMLTPRSPRAVSYNRAVSRTLEAQHMSSNTPRPAPPPHDASPLSGPPATGESYPFPGASRGSGPPPPSRPTSGLSRSLSQPIIGHGNPVHAPSLGRGLGSLPGAYPPSSPFTHNRGPAGHDMMAEWRLGPGPVAYGQGGGGAGPMGQLTDGQQHMIAITPNHGESILVPVNTHEGSKQMNEKRQRNAGASARFRHRKKIKDQALMDEMQKLENQNRDLQRRIRDLEDERDFYMNGGRPGEFVPRPRSPIVEERHDRGQSSPVSSKSGSSFPGENSPIPAPSAPSAPPVSHSHPFPHARSHTLAHPHPSPISYGDPSMLERPARRRRIDSAPELPARSYVSSPPATLPPIPPPAYGMPPSPHLTGQAGPPGSARLPPLRFDQPGSSTPTPPPAPGGVPPPPVPQQHRSGGPYPPYRRDSYSTAGWATEYKEHPPSSGPR